MTTSPPCLHETAWWPSGSKAMSGQKGQEDLAVAFMPSHPSTAVCTARDHIVCRSAYSVHILRYVSPYEPYAVFYMIHMQSQHNYRFGLITHTNCIMVCILSLHINCYASACVLQTRYMALYTKRMLHCIYILYRSAYGIV